jgi:hypothetical protein
MAARGNLKGQGPVTEVTVRPAEGVLEPVGGVEESGGGAGRGRLLFRAALVAVVAGAVVLRFSARQALWLDEAQSVAIASLPLGGDGTTLFDGLRADGSPPLYYLLLHGWIELFGAGTSSVRSLSALLNLAAAGPLYLLARRVVGPRAAAVAAVLYLTSPFALYFATETRMYSLVVLLTALGGLAMERVLRRPTAASAAGVALCAGAVALTHYWCLYLLLTVGAWLVLVALWPHVFAWPSRRGRGSGSGGGSSAGLVGGGRASTAFGRREALVGAAGIAAGGVVFAPWLGGFLYQLSHTGTPWGEPASFAAISHAYGQWAGGPTTLGRLLLFVVTGLVGAGVAGRAVSGRFIMIDLRCHEPGRTLFLLATLTLVVAVAAGQVVGNAWADRYTAIAFVPFLLVVGLGATVLTDPRVFRGVVLGAALVGLLAGAGDVRRERTQAGQAAHVLTRLAAPGDVLLVCPDQLGPGLARTVPSWLTVRVVPTYAPPGRVDWVDYEQRNESADGNAVADRALAEAGPGGTVFFAASGNYRTYEQLCLDVRGRLQHERPDADEVMEQGKPKDVYENYALLRFRPS